MLQYKRIYEASGAEDGYRILVDRLWPRGLAKEKANIDRWEKEIAPSADLRKKFHQEVEGFGDFQKDYLEELDKNEVAGEFLKLVATKLEEGNVTLLFAARDENQNNARVLALWLGGKLSLSDEEVNHG